MTTKEIIAYVIGAGGIGGLIAWARGRKKDKADVKKTIAEAHEIDANVQVSEIMQKESLLNLVDRLSKHLDGARVEIDGLRKIYSDTKQLFEDAKIKHKIELTELTLKLDQLEKELEIKQKNCITMNLEAKQLQAKIVEMSKKNKDVR